MKNIIITFKNTPETAEIKTDKSIEELNREYLNNKFYSSIQAGRLLTCNGLFEEL